MDSRSEHLARQRALREALGERMSGDSAREMTKRRFHIFLNRQGFKEKILDDETIKRYDRRRKRRKFTRQRDPWW